MRCQPHIGTIIYWTTLITCLALLIWALVRFGQSAHQDSARCGDRQDEKGFEGDPDLYGLGIRLGAYLQWIAQFLANSFRLDGWKSVLGTSIAFALALTGAVLIRTFENECVFNAEIIVIMFLFYGGVVVAFDGSPICNSFLRPDVSRSDKYTVTNSAAILPFVVMLVFNFWFWIRLATVGETDYVETPGGTFYFLFSRVSASSKPPAQFMVFVCAILTLAVVLALPAVSSWTFQWISRSSHNMNTRGRVNTKFDSSSRGPKYTPNAAAFSAQGDLVLM